MSFTRIASVCLVGCFVGLAACSSSSDSGSSAQASSCQQAKSITDSCKSQPSDGGVSASVDFDEAKCESGGDQAKQVADCIVAHKDDCSCNAACALKGTCP